MELACASRRFFTPSCFRFGAPSCHLSCWLAAGAGRAVAAPLGGGVGDGRRRPRPTAGSWWPPLWPPLWPPVATGGPPRVRSVPRWRDCWQAAARARAVAPAASPTRWSALGSYLRRTRGGGGSQMLAPWRVDSYRVFYLTTASRATQSPPAAAPPIGCSGPTVPIRAWQSTRVRLLPPTPA